MSQWDVLIVIHLSLCLCQSVPVNVFTDCVSTWCCQLKQIISWCRGWGGWGYLKRPEQWGLFSSHLGFSTLFIKCLFVGEVKRETGCQVSEWGKEGLGPSQGLFMFWQIWDWGWLNYRGVPTPFDFFSLFWPFACLYFLPLFVSLHLVSLSVFL